jgi:hypothetical protein
MSKFITLSETLPNFNFFILEEAPCKYLDTNTIILEINNGINWKILQFKIKYIGYSFFYDKLYEISSIEYITDDYTNENIQDKLIYNINKNTIDKDIILYDKYGDDLIINFTEVLNEIFQNSIPEVLSREKQQDYIKKYILVKKIEKLWENYWFEPYKSQIIDGKQIVYIRSILSKYKEMQRLIMN